MHYVYTSFIRQKNGSKHKNNKEKKAEHVQTTTILDFR